MSYYPALKQRLTCREAAPHYGLKVNASGMALCSFHDEHSPSLKLSRGFHCFGCGAQGDVITFVSRLFEIPPGEAAQKLSADFGIPAGDHSRGPPTARTEMETWVFYAKEILHDYYDLLIDWKRRYCPKASDEEWHPLFIEALQRQADVRQLIFELGLDRMGEPKQWEIREINDIMNHTIEGWESGTTKRIPGYGIQRTWHRKTGVGAEQLELPEGW